MTARQVAIELAVMIAIAVLLALIGPFGSFAAPLARRLADWLLFAVGGYILFRPVIAGGNLIADRSGVPRLLAIGIACALAAMPTTLLVARSIGGVAWRRLSLGGLIDLYPNVLLIGAIATGVQLLVQRRRAAAAEADVAAGIPAGAWAARAVEAIAPDGTESAPAAPPAPVDPPFLRRLPPALGDELLSLESEDHYVRAHTARGSTLILMRLADAVEELAGIDGARTHRRWWVARAAVAGVVRRDRAVALRLVNGQEVPVARGAVAELRAAGWL